MTIELQYFLSKYYICDIAKCQKSKAGIECMVTFLFSSSVYTDVLGRAACFYKMAKGIESISKKQLTISVVTEGF